MSEDDRASLLRVLTPCLVLSTLLFYLYRLVMSQEFFPTIGSVASKADDLPDAASSQNDNTDPADDERLIQEIESLCMKCHEQASLENL